MFIESIKIGKYRNLASETIYFNQLRNFIFGDNGQGKTNLLEAIYLLCLAKSFRTNDEQELVPFGDLEYSIQGCFNSDQKIVHNVSIKYDHAVGKNIWVDGKKLVAFSHLVGKFPVVILSSNDHTITDGAPITRRKFVNILLSQGSLKYLQNLKEYERILRQRNIILNDFSKKSSKLSNSIEILEIWTDSLVQKGTAIIRARIDIVNNLNQHLSKFYKKISLKNEMLKLTYEPNISISDLRAEKIEEEFRNKLYRVSAKEKQQGTTLAGPHRDDFAFWIEDRELRKFGSRGEHKSVLISLKATEALLLQDQTGKEPILLLDDLYSELDADRAVASIQLFPKQCQTFISGTSFDYDRLKPVIGQKIIHMNEGKVNIQ